MFQTFSQEKFNKVLLNWMVKHNQPFTTPKQESFIALIRTLNPDAQVIWDKTIKSDLVAAYADQKNGPKKELFAKSSHEESLFRSTSIT